MAKPHKKSLSLTKNSEFSLMSKELLDAHRALIQKCEDQQTIITTQGQNIQNMQSAMHGEWSWRGKLNELVILLKRRMEEDGKNCFCDLCRDTILTLDRQGIVFRDSQTADKLFELAWKPWEK